VRQQGQHGLSRSGALYDRHGAAPPSSIPQTAPQGPTGPHDQYGARIPEGGGRLRCGGSAAADASNQ